MRITTYRASDPKKLPDSVFWALDSIDDRFWAAFANYPGTSKVVVVAWATTGEVDGDLITALIATPDHIITGYLDPLSSLDSEFWTEDEEDEYNVPFEHDEPNAAGRLAALLATLRERTRATWLLVHDADEAESWIAQGFRVVELPADMPADQAVLVLAWGEPPEDVYALLRARGLSWNRDTHRGFVRHSVVDGEA